MQVSKFLLAFCATTVCAGFLSLQAQDTPAQAAARSALMNSLGQPPTATPSAPKTQLPPPTAPKAPTPPATPVAPAAPVVAAPAAVPVATASQPLDSDAQAACRAALLQAMGLPASSAPAAVAPIVAAPAPPPVKPVASSPAKAVTASTVGNESGYMPIVAPPLPISATKQHELDALLAHYKADQITPEEYHKQRSIILAEP
jgi:hypothetical protein